MGTGWCEGQEGGECVSGEQNMRDEEKSLNIPSRGEKQKHLCDTVLFM